MLGMFMAMAVFGIKTYLIMNPNEQDAIEYPDLFWHNHVGVTLPEWKHMMKTSRMPGYDRGTNISIAEDNAKLNTVYQFGTAGHPGKKVLWA